MSIEFRVMGRSDYVFVLGVMGVAQNISLIRAVASDRLLFFFHFWNLKGTYLEIDTFDSSSGYIANGCLLENRHLCGAPNRQPWGVL